MTIHIQDDFDLYKITYSGQCFRAKKLTNDVYFFIHRDNILFIKKTDDKLYDISCSESEWHNIWQPYFNLQIDYTGIRKSIPSHDTYLCKAAEAGQGIRILSQDYWEMTISFIISQRKTIPAIRSSVEKLCFKYGHKIQLNADCITYLKGYQIDMCEMDNIYSFPSPQNLVNSTEIELKDCGLGYRTPYILDAVYKISNSLIDLDNIASYNNTALYDTLTSIRGVGCKVANCIMLFGYNRLDSAPVDTWIQKVIDHEYKGINPFPSYGEYAGIMQQYVFYYAQHVQNK